MSGGSTAGTPMDLHFSALKYPIACIEVNGAEVHMQRLLLSGHVSAEISGSMGVLVVGPTLISTPSPILWVEDNLVTVLLVYFSVQRT